MRDKFIRCDTEFESVGEDLDMSSLQIVRGIPDYTLPDISRELAMLGMDENPNKIKESKHMFPIGTKVVVRGDNDYIVRGIPDYTLPDISRELAMLGMDENPNKIKEGKHMFPIGTKVVVRGDNDYMDKLTGRVGTVCRHYAKADKVGVKFDDIKNPDSKDGVFWFQIKSLLMYKESTPVWGSEVVKNVIFSGDKTIVLWSDGTKTIVSCGEGDTFDPYAGFCAAVTKKIFGTTSSVKRILKTVAKEQPIKSKSTAYPLVECAQSEET